MSIGRLLQGFDLGAKLVDQNALVFRVIDRHDDEMDAASLKGRFKSRDQLARLGYPQSLRAVTLSISNEIRVTEGQAKIREIVDGLFPTDHPVGGVLQN